MVIIELSVSNYLLKLILVQLVPLNIVNEVYFPLAFSETYRFANLKLHLILMLMQQCIRLRNFRSSVQGIMPEEYDRSSTVARDSAAYRSTLSSSHANVLSY